MKNFFFVALAALVVSCSATKSGGSTASQPSKKTLKGTWEVTNIRFVGDKGLYKAFLFDTADSACFNGSQWVFIPNNGSGKYTVNGSAHCEGSSQRIHWSFYGDNSQFQFYPTDAKGKRLDTAKTGYRANIEQLDATTFVIRVPTTYEGNPFEVVMTLGKVSDDITL